MKAKNIALIIAWAFFTFVAPIGLIITEFVIVDEPGQRFAILGSIVVVLLFFAYKKLLVARFHASDTPLARFIRTMEAILPLLIFAVLTIWFGELLRYLGGVVGLLWASLAIGGAIAFWRSKASGGKK